jgi:hypothetical protein
MTLVELCWPKADVVCCWNLKELPVSPPREEALAGSLLELPEK